MAGQEAAFRNRVSRFTCNSSEEARRLVQFAHACVMESPLADGQTPFALLESRSAIRDGVNLVGHWLAGRAVLGEPVTGKHLQDAWVEARREADTLSRDMVGATAAQWAAIAVIEAAKCAASVPRADAEIVQSVAFAALYSRAAGTRPSLDVLQFQIDLAVRMGCR